MSYYTQTRYTAISANKLLSKLFSILPKPTFSFLRNIPKYHGNVLYFPNQDGYICHDTDIIYICYSYISIVFRKPMCLRVCISTGSSKRPHEVNVHSFVHQEGLEVNMELDNFLIELDVIYEDSD